MANLQDLPEPPDYRSMDAPVLSAGTTIAPGATLASAALIKSGTTYENSAKVGDVHAYTGSVPWR